MWHLSLFSFGTLQAVGLTKNTIICKYFMWFRFIIIIIIILMIIIAIMYVRKDCECFEEETGVEREASHPTACTTRTLDTSLLTRMIKSKKCFY